MEFIANYQHMLDVMANKRPSRLPIYEHKIDPLIMETILNRKFAYLINGDDADLDEFFAHYCDFYQKMTYDTVSFEVTLTRSLPGHGAIYGGMIGPIQTRDDFIKYPWDDLPDMYWKTAQRKFDALSKKLPEGMKALGGVGNGVFEISQDLVGFEKLAFLMVDDPKLFSDIFIKIGDLFVSLWERMTANYGDTFGIYRFGDDLGFKTNTLVSPKVIRTHILPQYSRMLEIIKLSGKSFLWHSCGKIFTVMDDVIALGINGKHSNEDNVSPFEKWIEDYGSQIAILGGIDVDILCQNDSQTIFDLVVERGLKYREMAQGYALGSGNSIPDYVPVDGYLAMIRAAKHIRALELA